MSTEPIPARLARRPTVGGIVIPWVTVTLADGSPDWRACIRSRVTMCIHQGLCQLDGEPIKGAAVFFVAHDQMPTAEQNAIVTDIPPVHPECWRYAATVCPTLNGTVTAYADRPRRSATSRHNTCPDAGCTCGGYANVETRDNAGMDVPVWHVVWAERWDMSVADDGAPFAHIARSRVRRVRPLHEPGQQASSKETSR